MPKFQNIPQLIAYLKTSAVSLSPAKQRRLIKQLQTLSQITFSSTVLKCFEFTPASTSITLQIQLNTKTEEYILRLDKDYPYTSPQILYIQEGRKSELGYCKDLFGNLLGNQQWGPSLTLPTFVENLPKLANEVRRMERIQWKYHDKSEYLSEELVKSNMKLFKIKEYKWEYIVIKIKLQKILALTPDCCLIFEPNLQNPEVLKLDMWCSLKDISLVKVKAGKKKYTLQLHNKREQKENTTIFGGNVSDLETILDILNPIYSVERKVRSYDKNGIVNYDEAIQSYSSLIEHYSLVDKEQAGRYMARMKQLIEAKYYSDTCIPNKVGISTLSGQ